MGWPNTRLFGRLAILHTGTGDWVIPTNTPLALDHPNGPSSGQWQLEREFAVEFACQRGDATVTVLADGWSWELSDHFKMLARHHFLMFAW